MSEHNNGNYQVLARVSHATKVFGEVVAMSDVSFQINRGKIIGFLGPNGSGKTTSIESILGLIKPQSGQVTLLNRDPFNDSAIKHFIGYIPEEGVFPKWWKCRDFLVTMGKYHMENEEAEKRADEVLAEVNLTDVANKRIRQFSKGMKQRMKIAQALLHKPALIIADEPFNGLDPIVRRSMFDLMLKYNREYGTTFFVSSHILFEVEKIADTIILMYKGRTIAQGAPDRIREMILDQPHTILIQAENIKIVAKTLVEQMNIDVMTSVRFNQQNESSLLIETNNAKTFYDQFTKLVIENNWNIMELRPTDEGLETLFRSLTNN